MYLQWNGKSGTLSVPAAAAEHIEGADRTELAVLLLLASLETLPETPDEAAAAVAAKADCTEDEVRAALQYWRGAGVIRYARTRAAKEPSEAVNEAPAAAPEPKKPTLQSTDEHTYTGEEVARLLSENNGGRRKLIDECQNIAGKIFNTLEINKVLYLSDHLRLDNEYILLLFTYCRDLGKTSVHYAERTALNLYDEGVDDLPKLEAYLRRKEEAASYEGKVRTVFGIGQRALTKKEANFLSLWRVTYEMSIDMVKAAYEICVDRKGEASFAYINSILERWKAQGILTPEAAAADQAERRKEKETARDAKSSFDTDEFLELALRRSQAKADSLKQ